MLAPSLLLPSPLLPCLLLAFLAYAPTASAQPAAVHDPPRGDMRVVVFGDFNGPYGSLDYPAAVARTMLAITEHWRPDLFLSPGDLIAGQDRSLPDDHFDRMWATFDRVVAEPLRLAGIPYAAAMGNHDGSSLPGPAAAVGGGGGFLFERERAAARRYWSEPWHAQGLGELLAADAPFGYGFRLGPLFVAIVDASSARLGDAQLEGLRELLATPEATGAELRWVVGHLPLVAVSVGRDRPGEVLADPEAVRDLLLAAGVDSYISGHHAAYFPGHWEGLELLQAGGVGARRLLGWDAPPRSTVTLVDLWWGPPAPTVRYSTFDVATMALLPADALPASLPWPSGPVLLSPRHAR